MHTWHLKANHKVVKTYYEELGTLATLRLSSEGAVSPAFAALLRHCARPYHWTLAEQYPMKRGTRMLRLDGALLDPFHLVRGVWEAKDTHDDLPQEVRKKFDVGYPRDNILFQAPDRAILWQNGTQMLDEDISEPDRLLDVLRTFFTYQPPAFEHWEQAVAEFKTTVPELATGVLNLLKAERRTNQHFIQAFEAFTDLCRQALNPHLSVQAIEEMLIQHLLTERIFRRVFNNPDFVERNIIAREIEKVIQALTASYFSRQDFLKSLDRFYKAIEDAADTIDDYSQKQAFLNTVYEKFFQGFSVKVADTHGIVYTPQPIVDFMVRSVENILQKEFGRSLSSKGVHILDPFAGTSNFMLRIMREVKKTALADKYDHELHCNEVMLLPYYISSMNIEREYYELTGRYKSFEGICLVDTLELAEDKQTAMFTTENTQRVHHQKHAPIFVIISNPPYNAHQLNENDNNKNRKYPVIDQRVAATYAKDSSATNKNALSDMYVKAIRWAFDRIGDEGIVALITNNSFVENLSFDGMRKHLSQGSNTIYILDLGGNVRRNPQLSGTTHNVFGIQVGVSINIFVKKKNVQPEKQATIFYARTNELWRKEQKYEFLEEKVDCSHIEWQEITPDSRYNWLTEGIDESFEEFLPIGTKNGKSRIEENLIFRNFSNGVKTNRDAWAYNFNFFELSKNVRIIADTYNNHVVKFGSLVEKPKVDDFVIYDDSKISWSRDLKLDLQRGKIVDFNEKKIRQAVYRPFGKQYLFFDNILNEEIYQFLHIFPTVYTGNLVIWLKVGSEVPIFVLMVNHIPDLLPQGGSQCFPFYTYDEDGTNQQENITDWTLEQFRTHYDDSDISKWDIFHYVYAVLHHPEYREKYEANLKRELPRIPFAPDFREFAEAGQKLAELRVNYENQKEYPLEMLENSDETLNWRVEKMRLSKDKAQIVYNDFLTLAGIPPETFEYRLGNRSALDWIIDQYRVKVDKRSGIVNDPNRPDDEQYIVRLIGQVITVSLETMKILNELPVLK